MSRIVSKKLRDSARGQDCTLRLPGICTFDSQTTVLAHLPCGQKPLIGSNRIDRKEHDQ